MQATIWSPSLKNAVRMKKSVEQNVNRYNGVQSFDSLSLNQDEKEALSVVFNKKSKDLPQQKLGNWM